MKRQAARSRPGPARSPPPHFKAHQKVTQWRAPRLVGVAVFDAEGKPVGQVEDVLMSHAGVAETVVIGVGGFLGVGAKSVAIPFAAMQWRMSERSAAAPAAPADAGRPPRSGVEIAEAAQGHPDEADVTATRAELEQAPAFAYQPGGSAAPDSPSLPDDETQVSPYR